MARGKNIFSWWQNIGVLWAPVDSCKIVLTLAHRSG